MALCLVGDDQGGLRIMDREGREGDLTLRNTMRTVRLSGRASPGTLTIDRTGVFGGLAFFNLPYHSHLHAEGMKAPKGRSLACFLPWSASQAKTELAARD
jgi:hypothetical protein